MEKGITPQLTTSKSKKNRSGKGKDKPERTNKSKNGFKYKLKLDYIPIKGSLLATSAKRIVKKLLPGKIKSEVLDRKLNRLNKRLRQAIRPLDVQV